MLSVLGVSLRDFFDSGQKGSSPVTDEIVSLAHRLGYSDQEDVSAVALLLSKCIDASYTSSQNRSDRDAVISPLILLDFSPEGGSEIVARSVLSVLPSLKDANQVSARHLRSARAALSDAGFLLRENVVALQGIEGVTPSAVSAIESIGHRVAVVNSIDGLRSEEYSLRVSEKAWRARDSNQPFVFYCVSGDVRLRLLRCENPFRSKLAVVNLSQIPGAVDIYPRRRSQYSVLTLDAGFFVDSEILGMSLPPELYAETIIGSRKRLLEDEAMYDRYTLSSSGIGSSSRNVSESPSLKRQHTSVLVDDAASASVQGTMVPFDRRADVPKSPAVVPSHASWFDFDQIHDIERESFSEVFSRGLDAEKLYVDIRNFLVTTYRRYPTEYLSVTYSRRSIAADAALIYKIHSFLERWGLINFQEALRHPSFPGPPNAKSLPILRNYPPLPPSATLGSIFGEPLECVQAQNVNVTHSIKEVPGNAPHIPLYIPNSRTWEKEETLRLLEGIKKFEFDWHAVAQHVGTRTQAECIRHFVTMPIDVRELDRSLTTNLLASVPSQADNVPSNPFAGLANPLLSLFTFLHAIHPDIAHSAKIASKSDSDMTVEEASKRALSAAVDAAEEAATKEEDRARIVLFSMIEKQLRKLDLKLHFIEEIARSGELEKEQLHQIRKKIHTEHSALQESYTRFASEHGIQLPPSTAPHSVSADSSSQSEEKMTALPSSSTSRSYVVPATPMVTLSNPDFLHSMHCSSPPAQIPCDGDSQSIFRDDSWHSCDVSTHTKSNPDVSLNSGHESGREALDMDIDEKTSASGV